MAITLQDFASGDTNYVAALNSNNDVIEAAIAALQALTSGAALSSLTVSAAYGALFGSSVAVIGDESYVPTDAGASNLSVSAGYVYRPSLSGVLSKLTSTTLSFSGQPAGTYYVVIDATGAPTRDTVSTEAVYSVVWSGSAFTAITRLAAVVWGATDWIAAQTSTGLGQTYTSLDDRLEAIELDIAAAITAQAPYTVYAGPAGGSPTNSRPTFRALVSADLPVMVGDSGSGGVKGAAPAPGAGDAAAGKFLKADGTFAVPAGVSTGTVTSVAQTVPTEFAIAGSPVTTSGTLAITKATQTANTVWAGPTSGGAAQPAFRAVVAADLPVMVGDSGAGGTKGAVPAPGSGDAAAGKFLKADGTFAVPPGSTSGTVTSVNITAPAAGVTATGGPVTTSGSITLALANDLSALEALSSTGFAKRTGTDAWSLSTNIAASDFASTDSSWVLIGPSAGSPTNAVPTFRALVQADLPTQPYDVGGAVSGVPTASAVLIRYPFPRAVVFPTSLTLSKGVAATAATAQTDFDILKNASSIGTMRFAAAATTATFISASGASFAAGDILTVVAPASPDATLASVGFSLAGTR